MQRTVQDTITRFKKLRPGMINSIELQFIHMAQGGDGSAAHEGEIRNKYYPGWTTQMFQQVCNAMGWDWS